jgi:hypothetical protein
MYVRRKRPEYTPRSPTLLTALAAAVDAANARMRGFGRSEWDESDHALAKRILCNSLRKMPPPFPELADRI